MPKTRNVYLRIVESAASEAMCEYNFSNRAQTSLMEAAGISLGKSSNKIIKSRDIRRIAQSKKRSTVAYKKYRQKFKIQKIKIEDKKKEKGVTYGAGLF